MFKEKEILETPLYMARLENEVVISVYGDYARGDDGNMYKLIYEDDENGDMTMLGWEKE